MERRRWWSSERGGETTCAADTQATVPKKTRERWWTKYANDVKVKS